MGTAPGHRFRGDVQGLRAVAVLLVLVDHSGLPLTGGYVGVDVFFVISGFLITGMLADELRRTGTLSLRDFYARRARRLLPAAATVLAATGVLTVALVPRIRWSDIAHDIVASSLYVQNWRLAELSVDYQEPGETVSPLQHFWSLSVEEQFYLLWPVLLLLAWRERGRLGPRRPLLLAMVLVAVPSLVWSVRETAVDPTAAYFVTSTRLWELAVGGGVAILASRFAGARPSVAAVVGWCGLGAVCWAAVSYDGGTLFPGTAALVPVLGTAAVLGAGPAAARWGPGALLALRPMRWLGNLSYSLYLWHWPLLVIAGAELGDLTTTQGVAVVAASFVPAWLSYRLVEEPVRRSGWLTARPTRSLRLGVVCTGAATAVGGALLLATWPPPAPIRPVPVAVETPLPAGTPRLGALVLDAHPRGDPAGRPRDTFARVVPSPFQVERDIGPICTTSQYASVPTPCVHGDRDSDIEVALVGDSHAAQWTAPLAAIAERRGWRLTSYTKANCSYADVDVSAEGLVAYHQCSRWVHAVDRALHRDLPDLVVVSDVDRQVVVGDDILGTEQSFWPLVNGHLRTWHRLLDAGTQVVVLADTPRPDFFVPECVSEHLDLLGECTAPRSVAMTSRGSALVAAAHREPRVRLVDLSAAICPTRRCASVIGGVIVYRDGNHLSATYAGTLAPRLNAALPALHH